MREPLGSTTSALFQSTIDEIVDEVGERVLEDVVARGCAERLVARLAEEELRDRLGARERAMLVRWSSGSAPELLDEDDRVRLGLAPVVRLLDAVAEAAP